MFSRFVKIITYFTYRNFSKGLQNPEKQQKAVLKEILKKSPCKEIYDYEDFKKKIPISSFENIADSKFIALNDISFYEKTSGSSGSKKEIPYTKELINSFTRYFLIWTHKTLSRVNLYNGKLYFSISPQFGEANSQIQDDSDYLSGITGWFFNLFSVNTRELKKIKDPESFFLELAKLLLREPKLEVISVWSPSYLLRLLNTIEHNSHKLSKDTPYTKEDLNQLNTRILFPNLKLISCWGNSMASMDFKRIKEIFSHCHVQEKGLMATEAPMTLPWNDKLFLPIYTEVFFEFIPLSNANEVLLLHQLKMDEEYKIILTQKSGLWRYDIGDIVKVNGFVDKTPSLEFIGRFGSISDLVGEKISNSFLLSSLKNTSGFFRVVPSINHKKYFILTDSKDHEVLINALHENYHYRNAVKLGQLNEAEVIQHSAMASIISRYFCHIRGMKLGDIKDTILLHKEQNDSLLEFVFDEVSS